VQGTGSRNAILQAAEESSRSRNNEDNLRQIKGAFVRILAAFLLCWIAPLAAAARGNTPRAQDKKPVQAAPAQAASANSAPSIDPAKESAIRNMFEVLGMAKMMQQVIAGMSDSMKPMLTSSLPAGAYREKLVDLFFQKFQSKLRIEQLLDLAVPIYDKYFSKEEVEGLTRFYQTPLGQKALSVLPQSMVEMQTASMKLGEQIGRESMVEVLDEHPDLKKALEDAATSPRQ
jgi:hypothetical protein